MESIVRFAFAKYKETGVANSLSEAVRMCLNEDIFRDPRVKTSWMDFRKNNLYKDDVNAEFSCNLKLLLKLCTRYGSNETKPSLTK